MIAFLQAHGAKLTTFVDVPSSPTKQRDAEEPQAHDLCPDAIELKVKTAFPEDSVSADNSSGILAIINCPRSLS